MRRVFLVILMFILCLSGFVSCADIGNKRTDANTKGALILPAQDIRVLGINLLVADLSDSSRNLHGRDKIMPDLLLSFDADSIGVQETYGWVDTLDGALVGYKRAGFSGYGAIEPYTAYPANYIYYKEDKYRVIDEGIFWLTDTPDEITMHMPNCSWVILENKETGFKYVHMNTHLIANNSNENALEMPVIRDAMTRFIKLGFPVFTTGDFNASQGSYNYHLMLKEESIHDSKLIAEESMNMGTYHGMQDNDLSGQKPIDFCFVSHEVMDVHKYQVVETYVNGKFASDHNGIFVYATADSLPDPYMITPDISAEGVTVTAESVSPYVTELKITQATDCFHIDSYKVAALDSDGNEVAVRVIPSRSARTDIPTELYCTLVGLTPNTEYTVTVTPQTIIGTSNDFVETTVITPSID